MEKVAQTQFFLYTVFGHPELPPKKPPKFEPNKKIKFIT